MSWQPIETAPEGDVLVWCGDTKQQFVAFRKSGGLYQYAYYGPGRVEIVCRPTLWQPLPAAPALDEASISTAPGGAEGE